MGGEWAETAGSNREDADAQILVFGSPTGVRQLASGSTWFMDGNFVMAPAGFLWLYVIRVSLDQPQ